MHSETDIKQHNVEIHDNLRHWERKPLLREEYSRFYKLIADRLDSIPNSTIVECGSGIGNLKSVIPSAIATDLFPNPWIDRVENVFRLSFESDSVGALILFDVFHHLEYPGTALAEIHRVLAPGGRLVIFEPAMGVLGRIAFGVFHHEPLGLGQPITWEAPEGFDPNSMRYYAAQGNAWRVFVRREDLGDGGRGRGQAPRPARGLEPAEMAAPLRQTEDGEPLTGWGIREVRCMPAFTYLCAGGFRGPQLVPGWAVPVARWIDRVMGVFPRFFASRMLVVLEKVTHDNSPKSTVPTEDTEDTEGSKEQESQKGS